MNSLVNEVLMPPIGLILGKVDFANVFVVFKEGATAERYYGSLAAAKAAGVSLLVMVYSSMR